MIKVIHNSVGSGDWVQVWNDDELIHENHTITPNDLVDILNSVITSGAAVKMNVTDEFWIDGVA